MLRPSILIVASIVWLPALAIASTSKEVVMADRAIKPSGVQVDQRDSVLKIEICGTICELYSARRVKSEDEVWDVVLLRRAFFGDGATAKSFRGRIAAHVSSVMAHYAEQCSKFPQDASRATCILKYLGRRNRIEYSQVKYEGDQRCEAAGDLLAAGRVADKPKCERVRKMR